jgi:hypothetical protein
MPIPIDSLRRQVQHNCNISDARYGCLFSICGLLLRMRDLFKWEQHIPPWQEPEPAVLLEWIDGRETGWLDLTESDFVSIHFDQTVSPPFESDPINSRLRPHGLIYGAGYGALMKPSFLLAEIVRSEKLGDLTVHVVDRELARDLFTTPAMRQGDTIFARRDAMRFFLWDQIMQLHPSTAPALQFAFAQYGHALADFKKEPERHRAELTRIAHKELDHWIYHEVGETQETALDTEVWQEIVAAFSNSPVEIYARGLKDLLADTHPAGFLGYVTEQEHASSVGFYMAFMRPFAKALFPEIGEAFEALRRRGDWQAVRSAREAGYLNAQRHAGRLTGLYREGKRRSGEWAKQQIMDELIRPLGML